jgi:hypothetical protein
MKGAEGQRKMERIKNIERKLKKRRGRERG